jgi:hypothetical protein
MSLFEIRFRSPKPNRNLLTPNAASERGVAFQESAVAGTSELADGTKPIAGFCSRKVLVGGPGLGDHIYPGRLELPFTATQEAAFELAEEVEAEGANYIDGSITGGTALKTPLMFTAGKFALATTGKWSEFMLVEQMTPEVGGNVRIRAIAVQAYKLP